MLATGEGSWRTKSAANKVYAVKEKVNKGKLKISYVGTKEQCADALTKFLRSGTDQVKAREHLSLVDVSDCQTGRGEQAKACGLVNSSLSAGEFGPRACRVTCPESGELCSEFSDLGTIGPFSPARGKKRLCDESKIDVMDESVAISGQIRRHFARVSCERPHRDSVCTGYKDIIMVLIRWRTGDSSEETKMEVDEVADWAAEVDDQGDEWRLQNYVDIKNRLSDNLMAAEVSSIDTTSIVTKSDPIPMKDVSPCFMNELYPHCRYVGHNDIRTALLKDEFNVTKDKKISRWAMNQIDQTMRIKETCTLADKAAQWAMEHCEATLKSDFVVSKPSEEFIDRETGEQLPVVGIRVFHGGAQAVVNTVAYYYYYGDVRCNLAQDSHLAEGVYAYIDIAKALADIDKKETFDRTKCLGLVAGYLRSEDNTEG